MRYLINEPYINILNQQPLRLNLTSEGQGNGMVSIVEATTATLVRYLMEGFQPSNSTRLSIQEMRLYNRCLDVLESEEDILAFEDADYAILCKVVEAVLVSSSTGVLMRNAPNIIDILLEAPKEQPVANS